MKHLKEIALMLLFLGLIVTSCDSTFDGYELIDEVNSEVLTRATVDTLSLIDKGEITPLEITEELKALMEESLNNKKSNPSLFYVNDPYFSSNMYAIREMDVTLEARSAPSGSGKFLSSNGAGKEMVLSSTSGATSQRFYFKVLPASSGIPYLIYSRHTGTPLTVGQYDNAPDDKVVFLPKDNSGPLYSSSWDLVSGNVNGYFAIESQSHIGQGSSGSYWDIFYHVLETRANNKIRYNKYSKSAYQEFKINPTATFDLSSELIFDAQAASVYELTPTTKIFESNNLHEEDGQITVNVTLPFDESSNFSENKLINFKLNSMKYARPTVEAGRFTQPKEDAPEDATYRANETIRNNIKFQDSFDAPGRCKVEINYKLRSYRINVPYTVKATCGDRVITLSGTWSGTVHLHPQYAKPDKTIRFWSLETGKEISL